MQLVKPEQKYLKSYYEACAETWGNVHDSYIIHNPAEYEYWKNHIFEEYLYSENGINLQEGFMPSVTYWIIDGDEYAGTVNIRPKLNDRLKEYGGHAGLVLRTKYRRQGYGTQLGRIILNKIFDMGINEILLTCEETNIASQKILEKLNPIKSEKAEIMLNGKITPIRRYYFERKNVK